MSVEAMKLALAAFETLTQYNMVRANIFRRFEPTCTGDYVDLREFREKAAPVITALQKALAQPQQEPELRRLHAIEEAAKNLVKVKGRYHTEQAFNKLKEMLS
jgi:hypothetical protein